MRAFHFLLCVQIVCGLVLRSAAAEDAPRLAKLTEAGLSLASTNLHFLSDIRERPTARLEFDKHDGPIANLVAQILESTHYVGAERASDPTLSSNLLHRYIESLDGLHLHFTEEDIAEFASHRESLYPDLKKGRTDAALTIFQRFLDRVNQRVAYVQNLLENEVFTFDGEDRYDLNRKAAPRPKDLEAARQLWRQHLRYEILQDKLAKVKPEEIASKLARRYARLLRTFKNMDGQDVLEIYLSALGHVFDPHSDYQSKRTYDNFNINMSLSLSGIGAVLTEEDGYCKILELKPGPAMNSKLLKNGDRIVAVAQGDAEAVDTVEMKLSKVVDMIRGKKGTEVRLTVIPVDTPDERRVVSIVRDDIKLEDQEAKARIIDVLAPDGKTVRIGLLDLPSFYSDFEADRNDPNRKSSTTDVRKLLRKLVAENVEGVILDLRRNGGGSLTEAVDLTGLFIKEGPVVQVRESSRSRRRPEVDRDTDPAVEYAGPLLVLTSRFSASASEILAGALQDYGRAVVVGDSSTHGKGTVQTLSALDRWMQRSYEDFRGGAGALKYTIRKFYRASGSSTQLEGVTPDIVLPSVNNYAEVGEKSLDNPLAWDTIRAVDFEKVNLVQSLLAELRTRSEKRVATDKDFDYVREDIEQYKRLLKDRTVSLNEGRSLQERDEQEARRKAREADLKQRRDPEEKVYEISVKLALQEGLPEPVAKTNQVASVTAPDGTTPSATEPSTDPEDDAHDSPTRVPPVDVTMKEARRILLDLIRLNREGQAVAKITAGN